MYCRQNHPQKLAQYVFGALAGILLLVSPSRAQQLPQDQQSQSQPSQDQPSQDQRSQDQLPEEGPDQAVSTLKVNVYVVNLFFNVKDKRGALIPNLTKDNFLLNED